MAVVEVVGVKAIELEVGLSNVEDLLGLDWGLLGDTCGSCLVIAGFIHVGSASVLRFKSHVSESSHSYQLLLKHEPSCGV